MIRGSLFFSFVFFVVASMAQKPRQVSLVTELKPLRDISSLPAYRENTSIDQVSSYDTTGGNDDGFSGKYSFLRKIADDKLVIFDARGPGVINRIWTPTPSDDSLDFYIDDTLRPAFTIKYRDLFSGKVYPFVTPLCNNQLGGFYCYLPIPYQSRCMIVYRGKNTQFHQIGYRSYPKGTVVKKFNIKLGDDERAELGEINKFWSKSEKKVADYLAGNAGAVKSFKMTFPLKPGESRVLADVKTGGRIVGIELDPASAFEEMAKNIDIRITWDNEANPAVYCPVADFFGYGFGKASMESLLIGSAGGKNYCFFPMPFDNAAKVELIYRKGEGLDAVNITANISVLPKARDAVKEGKFYAHWNNQPNLPAGKPHEFLDIAGKGHYVGTVLQAKGLQPGMTLFFEGDDSTVVDGRLTMHGTGSEDYFNGGWYAMMNRWDAPFSMPLSGSLDYSLTLARTGGYRLFLSDKIPFEKTFYQSMEHGPEHNNKPAFYTSVAFFYGNMPAPTALAPLTAETRVFISDTLMVYPQLMFLNFAGEVAIKQRGETFEFTSGGESDVRIDLKEVPAGTYKLMFDYNKVPQGAQFALWQRQTSLTGYKDGYAPEQQRLRMDYMTDLTITPLNHALTIHLKATGDRKQFVLNRIILVKIKQP
ncbi:MAG: glycoside hydrolase family 172 protein [Chitinophagaceae bacterium]